MRDYIFILCAAMVLAEIGRIEDIRHDMPNAAKTWSDMPSWQVDDEDYSIFEGSGNGPPFFPTPIPQHYPPLSDNDFVEGSGGWHDAPPYVSHGWSDSWDWENKVLDDLSPITVTIPNVHQNVPLYTNAEAVDCNQQINNEHVTIVKNGEIWQKSSCESCTCVNGIFNCRTIECRICQEPQHISGECCPVCLEDKYMKTDFGDRNVYIEYDDRKVDTHATKGANSNNFVTRVATIFILILLYLR